VLAASPAVAWSYVACGAAVVLAYPLCPPDAQSILFLIVEIAAIPASFIAAKRLPNRDVRRPWLAVGWALIGFFTATILRIVVPGGSPLDPPSGKSFIPDIPAVPAYALLGYALLTFLRRRRAEYDEPARADALLIGGVAALATWAFMIAPRFSVDWPRLPVLGAAIFPMADVVLLVMVARLLMTDGARQASLWLFGTSLLCMFGGDLLYSVEVDKINMAGPATLLLLDVSYLSAFVLMGGAVLHPTMATLAQIQPVQVRRLGPLRTAGLAALLIVPMGVATLFPAPTLWNQIVRLVIGALIAVTVIARMVTNNNSRQRAEENARHRATHDGLTDLPNREMLADSLPARWEHAQANGSDVALLFLDIDRFKSVNDRWGHSIGDELLVAVADRLRQTVREQDLLCRIGADEFVVAIDAANDERVAETLAERILTQVTRPFPLSVTVLWVTASIGIAHSIDTTDAEQLIRDADTAMYRAKAAGRNGFAGFTPPMRDLVRRQADITQALGQSLTAGELAVVYQPIIDNAEQPTGFEALMRWTNAGLGFVSPMEFIPIAEDTGFIVEAGAWLMEEAAIQLAQWCEDRPPGLPRLHMSVNVSTRQLRTAEIIGTVLGIMERTRIDPESLWLEITESAVLEDAESSRAILAEIAALGITLCLDDFGTGYSSLTYLKQLPSGIVKIDKSFVDGIGERPQDETIVRNVINVAHDLGQRVVAEGVETIEQRDWLRAHGCDLFQGYLYSPPRSANQVRHFAIDKRVVPQPVG
jgi:diguanylate cyclase (GGDEF)-like protein